jgi:hypothetical protein
LVTGFGAATLTGPVAGGLVQRPDERADDVIEVDPRHVLLAAGHRPADAELEEGQHLGQGTPAGRHNA